MTRAEILQRIAGHPKDAILLAKLLCERFSCRSFRPDPVPRATLENITTLAQLSASWCNVQPWHLHITMKAATARFRTALMLRAKTDERGEFDFPPPLRYRDANDIRRREAARQLDESVGISIGDRAASRAQTAENFRLFGAPHAAILTVGEDMGVYGAVDCGGYIANLMLIAQSFGIACIAQASLAMHSNFIRDYFGMASDRRVVCGISLGYADSTHSVNGFRTPRADTTDAVTILGD